MKTTSGNVEYKMRLYLSLFRRMYRLYLTCVPLLTLLLLLLLMLSLLNSTTAPACLCLALKLLWLNSAIRALIGPPAGLICILFYDHHAPPSPSLCSRSCARLPPPVSIFHEGKESSAATAALVFVWKKPEEQSLEVGGICRIFKNSFRFRHFWRPILRVVSCAGRAESRPPERAGFCDLPSGWAMMMMMMMGVLLAWYPKAGWGFLRDRSFYTDTRVFWGETDVLRSRSIVYSFGVKTSFFFFFAFG